MEKINELKEIIEGMASDSDKFYNKENNTAGTRLRKQLNELKKKAQEIRNDILEIRNKRKV